MFLHKDYNVLPSELMRKEMLPAIAKTLAGCKWFPDHMQSSYGKEAQLHPRRACRIDCFCHLQKINFPPLPPATKASGFLSLTFSSLLGKVLLLFRSRWPSRRLHITGLIREILVDKLAEL